MENGVKPLNLTGGNESGGRFWIRTREGISQQIYSLPPLATWVTYQQSKYQAVDDLFCVSAYLCIVSRAKSYHETAPKNHLRALEKKAPFASRKTANGGHSPAPHTSCNMLPAGHILQESKSGAKSFARVLRRRSGQPRNSSWSTS